MITREGEIGILIADSGAFIKDAPLEKWTKNVITVREVVSEIRDISTRTRLQVLPYNLSFREPSHDAVHHVTAFAKKTGDYHSLSVVDLQVMALTYQLECELGPTRGAHLKREPARTQFVADKPKVPGIVGFYSGTKCDKKTEEAKKADVSSKDDPVLQQVADVSVPGNESETSYSKRTGGSVHQDADSCLGQNVIDEEDKELTEAVPMEQNRDDNEDWSDEEWDEDGDDSSGWITPENLQQVCEEMGGATEVKPNGIAVGCITTDFAMQNVMLQMGLNVISVAGMRIKQLRTYAKKCKACFKTTTKTSEIFCPSCGHRTLIKVSMAIDAEGVVHYHPLSQKQFSHRGLKYSLPLPKGGRHADTPVLTADQKNTYRERRRRVNKVDPLDPDYIARSSPFAAHDVTSRGFKVAFAKGGGGRGGGRRNPNAVGPKGKRK